MNWRAILGLDYVAPYPPETQDTFSYATLCAEIRALRAALDALVAVRAPAPPPPIVLDCGHESARYVKDHRAGIVRCMACHEARV